MKPGTEVRYQHQIWTVVDKDKNNLELILICLPYKARFKWVNIKELEIVNY